MPQWTKSILKARSSAATSRRRRCRSRGDETQTFPTANDAKHANDFYSVRDASRYLGRSLTLPPERRSPTRPVVKTPENAPDRKSALHQRRRIGGSVRMRPVTSCQQENPRLARPLWQSIALSPFLCPLAGC